MQSTKLTAFLIALAATAATVVAIGPVSGSTAATTGTPLIGIHLNDSNAPGSASAWEDSVVNGELDAGRRMDLVSTSPYWVRRGVPELARAVDRAERQRAGDRLEHRATPGGRERHQ